MTAYKKRESESQPDPGLPFLADSETLQKLLKRVTLIGSQQGPVLIEGESGTGKTHLAQEFHKLSNRCGGPFINIGCGEIHSGTMEATLFGHTKDAYTGAQSFQKGVFSAADKGTLVLNDIDRLPIEYQSKLLRFLDDGAFSRLGEPGSPVVADVRVVVTTNKVLSEFVRQDLFLPDLYYRLKLWRIKMPPLRDRPDDIRQLAHHFLECFRNRNVEANGSESWAFSEEVYQLFLTMSWPDNLRGLRSAVENIALFSEGDKTRISLKQAIGVLFDPDYSFDESMPKPRPNDREYLRFILQITNWNLKMAARITGFSRTTIYKRIEEEGWQKP